MKRKWKGLWTVFLAVMLMAACSVAGAVDGGNPDAIEEIPVEETNEPSINKTADPRLDEDYRATVTMTMPSDAVPLETDVVFVLDKSTSTIVEDTALKMLEALKNQVENTGAKVNVGVVIFNKVANASGFFDLETEFNQIEAEIKKKITSGTNAHAGLLAGKKLLETGGATDSRKYLIFVSDGITYIYGEKDTSIITEYKNDGSIGLWCSPDCWSLQHGKEAPTVEGWETWYSLLKGTNSSKLEYALGKGVSYTDFWKPISDKLQEDKNEAYKMAGDSYIEYNNGESMNYPSTVDVALFKTASLFRELEEKYNVYAVLNQENKDHPWGATYMRWLAGGKQVNFSSIQNDLCYLYGAGTVVTDVMGSGVYTDGKPYDFDFVANDDLIKIKYSMLDANNELIVEEYSPEYTETIDGNMYFGFDSKDSEKEYDYAFELVYYPNGNDQVKEEHFEMTFGRDIKLGEQVQLTYEVELAEACRKTEPGLFDDLLTNEVAYIDPVDSEGNPGTTEYFPEPVTSYENIGVVKKWAGDNDSAVRPSGLTIALVNKEDGKTKDEIKLNKDNGWIGTFLNIREGDYPDERFSMANYNGKTEYDSNKRIYTITNTYDAPAPVYDYTTVTITKIWDDNGYDGRPGSIKVKLGVENDPNYEGYTVKLSKDNPNVRIDGNTWTWSATIIDRNYYAEELYVDGYASKVEEVQPNQFVITNTYMPATGDDTPVTRYLLMLGGAALLIAAACVLRARKKA